MSAAGRGDALTVEGLRKRYKRRGPWALDDLSCRFPRGSVCGLVGPNGAGKTTLFSVVCGFLPPDAGAVDLLGEGPFEAQRLKGRVGILPQDAEIEQRLTPREFLRYMGQLQGMGSRAAATDADRVLAAVHLDDRARDMIGSLSHGMRRRLAVASALLGTPELVMLDEPTAGLDPVQARSLREVLRSLRGRTTLIVSSHNLTELEQICDWVVLIQKGKLIRQGLVSEITRQDQRVNWQLSGSPPLDALKEQLPGHGFEEDDGVLLHTAPAGADLDAASLTVMEVLAAHRVAIRGCVRGASLEESFFGRDPG